MLKADAKFQVERRLTLDELLEALAADGRINSAERRRLGSLSPGSIHPLVFLAEQKLPDATRDGAPLDMTALLAWLGERCGQSVVEIDPLKVNVAAVAEVMSRAFAERHRILAVEVDDDEVVIASAEPYQRSWQENLEHVVRRRIRRVLADPRDIMRFTAEFYTMAGSVRGPAPPVPARAARSATWSRCSNSAPSASRTRTTSTSSASSTGCCSTPSSSGPATSISSRAATIGKVRFRIDGVLNTVYELPDQVCAAVTSRIKILGRMDVAEKRRPQDGRLKTRSPGGAEVELRLSTLPTAFGEKLVMRIFDPELMNKRYEDLGLANDDLDRWRRMTGMGNGIVLVTGPTGSGKTTTLYSTLRQLATPEVNVCTIEDPIEMVEGAFNQMQVNHAIDLDFSTGVRTLMRQDPDIIMIGEIRDLETAKWRSRQR
jgi:general secretion pathway protein E